MQIEEESVRDYMRLYEEDFGEKLTMEEAREIVTRLVALYEVLCSRLPDEQTQKVPHHDIA